MKIFRLRMVWERLAREDPYWAVLTDSRKSGNRWDLEEFFATGEAEVSASLACIKQHVPDLVPGGSALDFGCGVGRLSLALAKHYREVVGVDVASRMIELANQQNRSPDTLRFVLNQRDDLAQFADHSFDLVFSLITLQHVPPELIRIYVSEFVRITRPGGLLYFQVPTFVPLDPPEIKRYSFYPPTMWKRIKRWTLRWFRQQTGIGDEMHMHTLPAPEVAQLLAQAGAKLITKIDHPMEGGCESYVYLARKI